MQKKIFDKIKNAFILKILVNLGIEEANFKIIKTVYNKPKPNIVLNRENLKAVPSKSGIRNKQGCPFSPFLFNVMTEVLGRAL